MTAGELIWGAIAFFFMVLFIAMFITAFGDVFRRADLSGLAKAGWIFLFFVVPFFGVIVYLIVRPKSAPSQARTATGSYPSDYRPTMGIRP